MGCEGVIHFFFFKCVLHCVLSQFELVVLIRLGPFDKRTVSPASKFQDCISGNVESNVS